MTGVTTCTCGEVRALGYPCPSCSASDEPATVRVDRAAMERLRLARARLQAAHDAGGIPTGEAGRLLDAVDELLGGTP